MSPRVLISESDWRLLEFAYGDLRQHGYDVIVESAPLKALDIISQWRPQVIIASSGCLGEWEKHSSGWLETMGSDAAVLVTVNTDDNDCAWQEWADRGCEVLFKPLVHASELRVATDQALGMRTGRPRARRGKPGKAGGKAN